MGTIQSTKTVTPPNLGNHSVHNALETSNQSIPNIVNILQSVDTKSPEAKLNATSISDNNGGRIELNQNLANTNDFEKIIKK